MSRLRTILLLVPAVITGVRWVMSYPQLLMVRHAGSSGAGWLAISVEGGLYLGQFPASSVVKWTGWQSSAQDNRGGRRSIEEVEGQKVERWKPVRYMETNNGRIVRLVILPWWLVTLVFALPAAWSWRRQSLGTGRGFEVSVGG